MQKLISVAEAAARDNCGRHTIQRAIVASELPAQRIGRGYIIAESDFLKWQQTRKRRKPRQFKK